MTKENLEIVRKVFAAWERGNFSSVAWTHPEITFVIADGPTRGSWTGVPAMAQAWRDSLAFDELSPEADEYRALDDERVLVLMHLSGRGKTSGLEVGGKVTRLVLYWNLELALADVGLKE